MRLQKKSISIYFNKIIADDSRAAGFAKLLIDKISD